MCIEISLNYRAIMSLRLLIHPSRTRERLGLPYLGSVISGLRRKIPTIKTPLYALASILRHGCSLSPSAIDWHVDWMVYIVCRVPHHSFIKEGLHTLTDVKTSPPPVPHHHELIPFPSGGQGERSFRPGGSQHILHSSTNSMRMHD